MRKEKAKKKGGQWGADGREGEDGDGRMRWRLMGCVSSASSISRSLLVGKKKGSNESSCSGYARQKTLLQPLSRPLFIIKSTHFHKHHHSYPHTRRLAAWWCKWGLARRCSFPELSAGGGWHRWRADPLGRSLLSWTGWSPPRHCRTHSAGGSVTALSAGGHAWMHVAACTSELIPHTFKTGQFSADTAMDGSIPSAHTHTQHLSPNPPANAPGTSRHDTYPPRAPQQRWPGPLPGGIAHTHSEPPRFHLDTAAWGPPPPDPEPRTPGSYLNTSVTLTLKKEVEVCFFFSYSPCVFWLCALIHLLIMTQVIYYIF